MKIAKLPSTFLPRIGGAEIVAHNLAGQYKQFGHDIHVITWWGLCHAIRKYVDYPIHALIPKSCEIGLKQYRKGNKVCNLVANQLLMYQMRYRFDIWHVHMAYPMGVMAVHLLQKIGVPIVLTCHGDDIKCIPDLGFTVREDPFWDRAIRDVLSHCDGVIAISQSMKDELLALNVPKEKILAIPNGIHVSRIKARQVDPEEVRKRLQISVNKTVILTVGRNHKQKGYDQIPDMIEQLRSYNDQFVWVVIGEGTESLMSTAIGRGLAGYLRVIPAIGAPMNYAQEKSLLFPAEELIDFYKSADMFVLPTRWESFGLVLIEAMAAGIPVITTTAEGCRDVVQHGDTGFLSEPDNIIAMIENIKKIIDNPELKDKIVLNASEYAMTYDWPRVAACHLEEYERIINEKKSICHNSL